MDERDMRDLRAKLGKWGETLSDQEVILANEGIEGFASMIFEWWLQKRRMDQAPPVAETNPAIHTEDESGVPY